MNKKIAPSAMCVDFLEVGKYIKIFEENNIDLIHLDIMDGSFVPNYTLGTDFVKTIKKNTNIPVDIHLMIEEPENKLSWFEFGEGDYVSVHYEATKHLNRVISGIKERGAKAMVALNPSTPICMLDNVLDDIDAILIMTVNPGFAGQKLVQSTLKKIKMLRESLDAKGYNNIEIEVDGNVSFENAEIMSNSGADIFVAGSSSVFMKGFEIEENIKKLRSVI